MLKVRFWALMGLLVCCAATGAPPAGPLSNTSDYRLGVGDTVRVEVREEPDLSIEAQVQADGSIRYPFLGSVAARGKTVSRLQQDITAGLRAGYLVNPDVRVRVVAFRPFYVTGQVVRPGGYPYLVGLTVEKAATIAGGFTDRASLRSIYMVHEGQRQSDKQKVSLDAPVLPGDTIIVEESFF